MILLIMILAQIILCQVFGKISIILAAYDMAITRNGNMRKPHGRKVHTSAKGNQSTLRHLGKHLAHD